MEKIVVRKGIFILLILLTFFTPLHSGIHISFAEIQSSGASGNEPYADFNGDGYSDLAIGVPLEDVGGLSAPGAVNVLYGSSSGLQASSPDDQFWHQNSPGVRNKCEEHDNFGRILAG